MDQTDHYASLGGRFYSAYIEHPVLGRAIIRLLWGGDARPMYRSLEALGDVEAGVTVVDAGCGAGLALHWLEPSRVGRYLRTDDSPAMLARARDRANQRGFSTIELELADIAATPLEDAEADLYLLYNVLHVVSEPQAAVAEATRCLKPGGQLVEARCCAARCAASTASSSASGASRPACWDRAGPEPICTAGSMPSPTWSLRSAARSRSFGRGNRDGGRRCTGARRR